MAVTPEQYQHGFDERIGPLVAAAAERVSAFRSRLTAAGLAADDLVDVSSLDRLPVMSKDDLLEEQRRDPPFGGLLAEGAAPRRVFQSPGPLYEPETSAGDGWRWAPALEAAGIDGSDRVLNAFGYHLSPAGAMFEAACLERGAAVVPAGVGSKDLQVAACRDLGLTAYIGTPSYLKALLETAGDIGTPVQIDKAVVTAEPLPPSLRRWLEDRVAVVRQAYGTAECGNLGYECEAVAGFHVPDDALVQIADLTTGTAVDGDGQGQVVVTLFDHDYVLVRFGTGDLSSWVSEPCPCGRDTPRIAGWQGRVGDAVKVRGMFLHPRQVEAVVGGLDGVAAYRMVIDRFDDRDVLQCSVVADRDDDDLAERVRHAVRDGLRFNVDVAVVDELGAGQTFEDRRVWR